MNDPTIEQLAHINRALYHDRAAEFSRTRQRAWVGWGQLLALTRERARPEPDRTSVLDVGCGNGRFARFLLERLGRPFDYVGVDASAPLLEVARGSVPLGARLIRADLVFEPIEDVLARQALPLRFDLVVAMGLLHHLPAQARRAAFTRALAGAVVPGGLLALSFWELERTEAFARRRVTWSEYRTLDGAKVDTAELEPGDHLLRFGPEGLRYCHHASAAEQREMVAATGLSVLASYEADEHNRYVILERRA